MWVLTGDKMETAINIAMACNLLDPGMERDIVFFLADSSFLNAGMPKIFLNFPQFCKMLIFPLKNFRRLSGGDFFLNNQTKTLHFNLDLVSKSPAG